MIISKRTLEYQILHLTSEIGDVFLEFLLNDLAKGKRVYLGRRRYASSYCRNILRVLTTTGYIERVSKRGNEYLRLTPIGSSKIRNDIPLLYLQRRKWEGYFHGIAYDFPEKNAISEYSCVKW